MIKAATQMIQSIILAYGEAFLIKGMIISGLIGAVIGVIVYRIEDKK